MAGAAGGSADVVPLPKGGGAIAGIGETFSPDLFTGTAGLKVPLALPPGRAGLQPALSLVYNSGFGNGPFGMGWKVDVPGVDRKTARGIPRYDHDDVFVLSGTEDLVEVERHDDGSVRYRPRTEDHFARIVRRPSADGGTWEVRLRDGTVTTYGVVVADPADRPRVFGWRITETVDALGNRVVYDHERDLGQEGLRRWDQLYMTRVRYGDHVDDPDRFLVSVVFVYDERPDPVSDHRAGFEVRTTRRCTRIEIHSHLDGDRLVRTYDLVYLDQLEGSAARPLPSNGASLLAEVRITGHDGDRVETFPALKLGYSELSAERRDLVMLDAPGFPARSLGQTCELVSLFGDGLPDLIEMERGARFWKNLGDGRFALARELDLAPSFVELRDGSAALIDADGDGRVDVLDRSAFSGYWTLAPEAVGARSRFHPYRAAPPFPGDSSSVELVDLDGDSWTDALRSATTLECYFQGSDGWTDTRHVDRRGLDEFPDVDLTDVRVHLADMTGDGLTDLVLVHEGVVDYWPTVGRGAWGPRVSMAGTFRLPWGYSPQRVLVGDVDGDGAADIVYVDDGRVTVWINQFGGRWSDPIEVTGTPRMSDEDHVRLVDVFGSGTSGVLWSTLDPASGGPATLCFLDITGGVKPYLLTSSEDGMGASSRVTYRPSTAFMVADERAREPWRSRLPFPVQVVASLESVDAISGGRRTSEFRYRHGCWDGLEREFRGFARVDELDTQSWAGADDVPPDSYAAPVETRHFFDPGPIGDAEDWFELDVSDEHWDGDPQRLPRDHHLDELLLQSTRAERREIVRSRRGTEVRTELYGRDRTPAEERPYTVTESLFGVSAVPPSTRVFFPHVLARRTTHWERGTDPLTQFAFTDRYDEYGQSTWGLQVAVPRGRDPYDAAPAGPTSSYLAIAAETAYAQRDDDERYIVDRVARTRLIEIANDGSSPVADLVEGVLAGALPGAVVEEQLGYFDGPAFVGLPFGEVGDRGIAVRSEVLVVTPDQLDEAFGGPGGPGVPPFLVATGPSWTADYPVEVRERTAPLAGFTFDAGGPASHRSAGYYATDATRYDVHERPDGRGAVVATRDAMGAETIVESDGFGHPVMVIDPAGLVTSVTYDPRTCKPAVVVDPQGSETTFAYTPLGLLESAVLAGRPGDGHGDTPESPTSRFEYDLSAFVERGRPTSVRTVRRVHHAADAAVPEPRRSATLTRVEYSDGFGRLLQAREQAALLAFGDAGLPTDPGAPVGAASGDADDDRVVVTGWQTYDNKGQVIEKYEPFFSSGWAFAVPGDEQRGRKLTISYDPRGRGVLTVGPRGEESRVVQGVPVDLADPTVFDPTPWETYTYDANDNAGHTHPVASASWSGHWDTPTSSVTDALGRTVETVVRLGTDPSERMTTHFRHDIRGELVAVVDPLGRVATTSVLDCAGEVLRSESIDSGTTWAARDAGGRPVERRTAAGAVTLTTYDILSRAVGTWMRDRPGDSVVRRLRVEYGDGGTSLQDPQERAAQRAANRLGRVHRSFDGAGLLTVDAYDFTGHVLEATRRVPRDEVVAAAIDAGAADHGFSIDWGGTDSGVEATADATLESVGLMTTSRYDALGRMVETVGPAGVDGQRSLLVYDFAPNGAIERVTLDGETVVEHVAYSARGQRLLAVYGNGTMTRSAFHPDTAALVRLRTEPFATAGPAAYAPAGPAIHDVVYDHDLVGNVVRAREPDVDRAFAYDAAYRLVTATGREHDDALVEPPWLDSPRGADPTKTRAYEETYTYDACGNLTRLKHDAGATGSFTRVFAIAPGSNRLADVTAGQSTFVYEHDASGHIVLEAGTRRYAWDAVGRLRVFSVQAGDSPSLRAVYLYDSVGTRVKKLVRRSGGFTSTVYAGGGFERRRHVAGSTVVENTEVRVGDDLGHVATFRTGPPLPDDTMPEVRYEVGDHLGSVVVTTSAEGDVLRTEEYLPYGETSFGGYARKRYRFAGKERDEESGLSHQGDRYYAPWLSRWCSPDPAGMVDGPSLYTYARSSPLVRVDPTGTTSVVIALQRNPDWIPVTERDYAEKRKKAKAENPAFAKSADNLIEKTATDKSVTAWNRELVFTGREFVAALERASKAGPIKNIVIYGHSGGDALYPGYDRGLYRTPRDKPHADAASLLEGTDAATDLRLAMKAGNVKFADDAVVVFGGCNAANHQDAKHIGADAFSLARRFTEVTGVTTIASVGGTDRALATAAGLPLRTLASSGGWVITYKVDGKVTSYWLDIPRKTVTVNGTKFSFVPLDPSRFLVPEGPGSSPDSIAQGRRVIGPINFSSSESRTPPGLRRK